jgi:hypothetical protein
MWNASCYRGLNTESLSGGRISWPGEIPEGFRRTRRVDGQEFAPGAREGREDVERTTLAGPETGVAAVSSPRGGTGANLSTALVGALGGRSRGSSRRRVAARSLPR